jgi:hypothetical protein
VSVELALVRDLVDVGAVADAVVPAAARLGWRGGAVERKCGLADR